MKEVRAFRIEELDKMISQGISMVMDEEAGYCDACFYSEDGSETIFHKQNLNALSLSLVPAPLSACPPHHK